MKGYYNLFQTNEFNKIQIVSLFGTRHTILFITKLYKVDTILSAWLRILLEIRYCLSGVATEVAITC